MKKGYNPYPHNNERCGTLQYEDYEIYEYKFYNDKQFHEERIALGKAKVSLAKFKAALLCALTGACAYGTVAHVVNFANNLTVPSLFVNAVAVTTAITIGYYTVKDGIIPTITFIRNAKMDLEASKGMIETLSKRK